MCALFAARSLLFIVRCSSLSAARCLLLFVVRWLLSVCRSLFVLGVLSVIVRCVLFAVG